MDQAKVEQITRELALQHFGDGLQHNLFLEEMLSRRIGDLLETNPTLLKSIFYRIDINENLLGMALVSMQGEELHHELARLVIERLKKKAETRLKYS